MARPNTKFNSELCAGLPTEFTSALDEDGVLDARTGAGTLAVFRCILCRAKRGKTFWANQVAGCAGVGANVNNVINYAAKQEMIAPVGAVQDSGKPGGPSKKFQVTDTPIAGGPSMVELASITLQSESCRDS